MARIVAPTWPGVTQAGVDPRIFMRNGVRPGGPIVAQQTVGLLNHCLGYRLRRHFAKSVQPAQLTDPGGAIMWRWFMRTMPNETKMRVSFVFGPYDSSTPEGEKGAYVKITRHSDNTVIYDDGSSGIDGRVYNGNSSATPTSATADDLMAREKTYTLAADTEYRCEVWLDGTLLSVSAYGIVRTDLDPATDVVVDPKHFLVNEPITSTANADLLDSAEMLWKRHGAAYASWSVNAITAKTITGTTLTNILDGTTTWTSTTMGFLAHTLNKHSLDTTLGTPTYGVPVKAWVYASSSATGLVRFAWGTGGSDYVDVTGITSAGWYTGTGVIAGNVDQKIDIYGQGSAGGVTCNVYAAGIFDYSA